MPTSRVSKRAALLKKAPIPTVKWRVVLGRSDDVYDELDSLVDEYNALCQGEDEPPAEAVALQPRISELTELITTESTVSGRFVKEPSLMKWEAFLAEHPPRVKKGWKAPEDDPEAQPEFEYPDSVLGFDLSTAYPAAVRKYMTEPMDDEEWENFSAQMAAGDWTRLGDQIVTLNQRSVSVPKLPRNFTATTRQSSG
jgi:hypothetical protein